MLEFVISVHLEYVLGGDKCFNWIVIY